MTELPQPPAGPAMVMLQHFEPLPSAHLMALYLQAFDNQPGISIPFPQMELHPSSELQQVLSARAKVPA